MIHVTIVIVYLLKMCRQSVNNNNITAPYSLPIVIGSTSNTKFLTSVEAVGLVRKSANNYPNISIQIVTAITENLRNSDRLDRLVSLLTSD